jgi:type I restriction enzyme M protein
MDTVEADADKHGVKLTAKRKKLMQSELCDTHEDAAPVLKKVHKPGKAKPDPIHGLFETEVGGKHCVVEYEPDTGLRDSEQVPLLEEGGIEEFFRREVLPYTPDAWIDPDKTLVGYEISFTRHFYRPAPMRTLDEIKSDIYALEHETEGLLDDILIGGNQ